MNDRTSRSGDNPIWTAFRERHPHHRFLSCNPVYALSLPMIEAIREQVPTFFAAEDLSFERDLTETTVHGFFLGCPIGGDWFPRSPSADRPANWRHGKTEESLARLAEKRRLTIGEFVDRVQRSEYLWAAGELLAPPLKWPSELGHERMMLIDSIKTTMAMLRENQGREPELIKRAQEQERTERKIIEQRQEAYAGWLVTNFDYRAEIRVIKLRQNAAIQERREFPSLVHRRFRTETMMDRPATHVQRDWLRSIAAGASRPS